MQRFFFVLLLCISTLYSLKSAAQNVAINAGGDPGHASSILDVESEQKGVLLPRMSAAQRNAINAPAEGLLVYQNDGDRGFYVFTGSEWRPVSGSAEPAAEMDLPETVTVHSTDFLTTGGSWAAVPGMTASYTVPPGKTAAVNIIADLGLVTNGTGNNNHSCTDLALIRDGALLPEAGYKRVTAGSGSNTNHNNYHQNPVITGHEVLGPGTYTFRVVAIQTCSGGQSRPAIMAGGPDSVLQGSMTLIVNYL